MGAPPVVSLLCQRPSARPVSMRSGKSSVYLYRSCVRFRGGSRIEARFGGCRLGLLDVQRGRSPSFDCFWGARGRTRRVFGLLHRENRRRGFPRPFDHCGRDVVPHPVCRGAFLSQASGEEGYAAASGDFLPVVGAATDAFRGRLHGVRRGVRCVCIPADGAPSVLCHPDPSSRHASD